MKKRLLSVAMITAMFGAFLVPAQMAGAAHGAICEQVILAAEDSDTVTVTLPGGATETYEILRAEDGETSGGSGNQAIIGTSASETLSGGSGNDILCGLGGSDTLNGGSGSDQLVGDLGVAGDQTGAGDDFLNGGSGNDGLYGDNGNDVLEAGSGADFLSGAAGVDVCDGGSGSNSTDSPTTCEDLDL